MPLKDDGPGEPPSTRPHYDEQRTTFACLPVTALHTIKSRDSILLLSGQGPSLRVHDTENRHLLLCLRVFDVQAIHGITSWIQDDGDEVNGVKLLIWGGRMVSMVQLTVHAHVGRRHSYTGIISIATNIPNDLYSSRAPLIDVGDWILHGSCYKPDCGTKLRALVVTTHNELLELTATPESAVSAASIDCTLLVAGPNCVLYSAHAYHTSPDRVLVAAGTVFGEIVVWSASRKRNADSCSVALHYILPGHRGSIFGVRISDETKIDGCQARLLASCSDDRSIRIWDISNCCTSDEVKRDSISPKVQLSDVTGFAVPESEGQKPLLAMAWGHLSRIWDVRFVTPLPWESPHDIRLITTGEDATSQEWTLDFQSLGEDRKENTASLRNMASNRHHSGKNIWSCAQRHIPSRQCYVICTGGADGSIVTKFRNNEHTRNPECDSVILRTAFADIIGHCKNTCWQDENIGADLLSGATKQYAAIGENGVLATTDAGGLLFGKYEALNRTMSWERLHQNHAKSPLLLCGEAGGQVTFFADADGSLFAVKNSEDEAGVAKVSGLLAMIEPLSTFMCIVSHTAISSQTPRCILVPSIPKGKASLFWFRVENKLSLEKKTEIGLPPGFVPTSACYHCQANLLVLGSRAGGIAIYQEPPSGFYSDCLRSTHRVHGTDTVTSLTIIGQQERISSQMVYILSTGRDGTYAVHSITLPSANDQPFVKFQTVHRSSPPFGPNIEGAYFIMSRTGDRQDLVLYGFRSKDFISWNESQQTQILSTECGGSHRSWTYSSLRRIGPDYSIENGGCFVWTKAGSFNLYRKTSPSHQVVQAGGHGREIKALAVSPAKFEDNSLVATGAEDTTIRLFAFCDISLANQRQTWIGQEMKCLRVLNKHTTGIHHLQFSSCGQYLFSSGGCEELFVWRIWNDIPAIGVGVVLDGALTTDPVDSDARITCFTVQDATQTTSENSSRNGKRFSTAAAYSNGKVKVLEYNAAQDESSGSFQVLQQIGEGTFCLTQIHNMFRTDRTADGLITAGTNGRVSIFSNGINHLSQRQQIHQSSIKALECISLSSGASLVITGGDDNAIGFTIVSLTRMDTIETRTPFPTVLIPKAHAAAVTAISIISRWTGEGSGDADEVVVASTGNDQRVKLWHVTVHPSVVATPNHLDVRGLQVEKWGEAWTSVADVGAMETLPTDDSESATAMVARQGHCKLLLVGVGMEILRMELLSR